MRLLTSGIRQLEELTGLPVLGVIPYTDMHIPSEDSMSIKDKIPNSAQVRIAIIKLSHISNFTDFEPLEKHAGIEYVEIGAELSGFDAIILPGTKNTIDDLKELKSSGMESKILEKAKKGTPVIGICGGYQMLGKEIIDSGVEGTGGACLIKGLGLLDVSTRFEEYKKETKQTEKTVTGDGEILGFIKGETVKGYEIHMGKTRGGSPAFGDDGCISNNGLVFGTYLHGLFENENLRDSFLGFIYKRKGLTYTNKKYEDADNIEELADLVEKNINMDLVYRMLEE
jgi:adenosylcobyric acid synthase